MLNYFLDVLHTERTKREGARILLKKISDRLYKYVEEKIQYGDFDNILKDILSGQNISKITT